MRTHFCAELAVSFFCAEDITAVLFMYMYTKNLSFASRSTFLLKKTCTRDRFSTSKTLPQPTPPADGTNRSLQASCGVSATGIPSNAPLHALFSAASTLGDEAFYTVALPLCAWVLDLELSRRLAFFWASTYYVGQSAKVMCVCVRFFLV